jgi:hypothetical protein
MLAPRDGPRARLRRTLPSRAPLAELAFAAYLRAYRGLGIGQKGIPARTFGVSSIAICGRSGARRR